MDQIQELRAGKKFTYQATENGITVEKNLLGPLSFLPAHLIFSSSQVEAMPELRIDNELGEYLIQSG